MIRLARFVLPIAFGVALGLPVALAGWALYHFTGWLGFLMLIAGILSFFMWALKSEDQLLDRIEHLSDNTYSLMHRYRFMASRRQVGRRRLAALGVVARSRGTKPRTCVVVE